jgi:DNA mismatch endonuclease, patch repair protein
MAASPSASRAKKANTATATRCELHLRRTLWSKGMRYRVNVADLPGRPDIVFPRQKIAIFCDGDFWHGRSWDRLKRRLRVRHNSAYWIAKISANRERDHRNEQQLSNDGWLVLRFWETDILKNVQRVTATIEKELAGR